MNSKLWALITGLFFIVGGSFAQASPINLPPVADANGPYAVTTTQYVITMDGSGSYDPDPGDFIQLYEWDFDGDGTFDWSGTSPNVLQDYSSLASGLLGDFYNVGLRVTDGHGLVDINFTTVTLVENVPVPIPATLVLLGVGFVSLAAKGMIQEGI